MSASEVMEEPVGRHEVHDLIWRDLAEEFGFDPAARLGLAPIVVDRKFLIAAELAARLDAVRAAVQLRIGLGDFGASATPTVFASEAVAHLGGRVEVPFPVLVLETVEGVARQLQSPTKDMAKFALLLALDNAVIESLGRYEPEFMRLQQSKLVGRVGHGHAPGDSAVDALASAIVHRCVAKGKPPAVDQYIQGVLSDAGVRLMSTQVSAGALKKMRSRARAVAE